MTKEHPHARAELGKHIRALVEAVGTQTQAAAIAGITVQQLGRLMRGANAPSLLPLARLSEVTGISLDWVAFGPDHPELTGIEEQRPASDPELFGRLVDGIGRVYQEEGAKLPAIDLGRIAAMEYDLIVAAVEDSEERRIAARLTAERIRRELRADAVSHKEQASG
jgi:transcriptional regulator with XRE-family HTH domain